MKNSVIIYSGGMDSTVLLHEYQKEIAIALSFDYGSKHNRREISFAVENCKALNMRHVVIDLPFMLWHFSSALLRTSEEPIPHGHYEDQSMRKTIVPFRNGIMLAIAAGFAQSNKLTKILYAAHKGDHAIYPDCRPEFHHNMHKAIWSGTAWDNDGVSLLAPFVTSGMTKREIALMGQRNGTDFAKTWSCYEGNEVHCGQCGTCVERIEALKGFDPTPYANL